MTSKDIVRCGWVGDDDLYRQYHDEEWGVPEWDDQALFEKLILDGAQAGLSWITILRKRDNYREAFDQFDVEKIARYDERKIQQLMQNAGIVRNQLKIRSTVGNAQAYLEILEGPGSFSDFLWQFVDGEPVQNAWQSVKEIPVNTVESDAMSKALKQKGFKFVGTTICYAFMQAVGMVNDHTVDCFRYSDIQALAE
ncbi:MAG: DNA-3-methyladenine glycosylase I [bacterium]